MVRQYLPTPVPMFVFDRAHVPGFGALRIYGCRNTMFVDSERSTFTEYCSTGHTTNPAKTPCGTAGQRATKCKTACCAEQVGYCRPACTLDPDPNGCLLRCMTDRGVTPAACHAPRLAHTRLGTQARHRAGRPDKGPPRARPRVVRNNGSIVGPPVIWTWIPTGASRGVWHQRLAMLHIWKILDWAHYGPGQDTVKRDDEIDDTMTSLSSFLSPMLRIENTFKSS